MMLLLLVVGGHRVKADPITAPLHRAMVSLSTGQESIKRRPTRRPNRLSRIRTIRNRRHKIPQLPLLRQVQDTLIKSLTTR